MDELYEITFNAVTFFPSSGKMLPRRVLGRRGLTDKAFVKIRLADPGVSATQATPLVKIL